MFGREFEGLNGYSVIVTFNHLNPKALAISLYLRLSSVPCIPALPALPALPAFLGPIPILYRYLLSVALWVPDSIFLINLREMGEAK